MNRRARGLSISAPLLLRGTLGADFSPITDRLSQIELLEGSRRSCTAMQVGMKVPAS